MATVKKEVSIAATPDEVWAVVGDVGGISQWFPAIEASSLEGDTRVCELAGGRGTLKERITANDPSSRTYSYTIVDGPMPVSSHEATVVVESEGDGAKVVWTTVVEPDQIAEAISPMFDEALAALKERLEG